MDSRYIGFLESANVTKVSVFINSWNSPAHDTFCVHGFIDGNDGTAYQTLLWNHRGWHCGSGSKGSGNNTHIGVELFAMLCEKYSLDPFADGVINAPKCLLFSILCAKSVIIHSQCH